jgi:hypothetical protein
MPIVAVLFIPLFLVAIVVKLLLDLYAEEPDSSESGQQDQRRDSNQNSANANTS